MCVATGDADAAAAGGVGSAVVPAGATRPAAPRVVGCSQNVVQTSPCDVDGEAVSVLDSGTQQQSRCHVEGGGDEDAIWSALHSRRLLERSIGFHECMQYFIIHIKS